MTKHVPNYSFFNFVHALKSTTYFSFQKPIAFVFLPSDFILELVIWFIESPLKPKHLIAGKRRLGFISHTWITKPSYTGKVTSLDRFTSVVILLYGCMIRLHSIFLSEKYRKPLDIRFNPHAKPLEMWRVCSIQAFASVDKIKGTKHTLRIWKCCASSINSQKRWPPPCALPL